MNVLKWLNQDVEGITPYEPGKPVEDVAREMGLDPDAIIKIASNENPLGPARKSIRAMRDAVKEMHIYPDGGTYRLRNKLAETHGLDPGQFVVGAGSNEVLEFIGHCFMGPNRSVVASSHAFVVYKLIARMFGTELIDVPTKGLGHDLTAMRRAIRPDTSVIFICNPNNPTGTLVRQAQVRRFMEQVPDDVLVVFDEAYAEIALSRMPDTLRYVRDKRNVIVLRTFSKAYGLAGLRVGYGMGPVPIITALQKARQPFNVNRMAQLAATAALDDHGFLRRSRRLFRAGRETLEAACAELGLEYERSYANFMLIRVGDAQAVTADLMKRGVIVRPMAGYGLPEHIRVSFGTEQENERFIAELKQVLNG